MCTVYDREGCLLYIEHFAVNIFFEKCGPFQKIPFYFSKFRLYNFGAETNFKNHRVYLNKEKGILV
jgi:hypothetical protein